MDPMTLDAPMASADHDARRVSPEPADGFVLDPWSGLYTETEEAYRSRVQSSPTLLA